MPTPVSKNNGQIPTSLASPGAVRFWLAVCLIGASTGLAAAALTRLLGVVQRAAWNGSGTNILETARQASAFRHIAVLLAAGILTGAGQVLLKQVPSGNGIDTTAAIWFYAGRMPAPRTPGSALLSIFAVGMGQPSLPYAENSGDAALRRLADFSLFAVDGFIGEFCTHRNSVHTALSPSVAVIRLPRWIRLLDGSKKQLY
jgi:hypothetical protein